MEGSSQGSAANQLLIVMARGTWVTVETVVREWFRFDIIKWRRIQVQHTQMERKLRAQRTDSECK